MVLQGFSNPFDVFTIAGVGNVYVCICTWGDMYMGRIVREGTERIENMRCTLVQRYSEVLGEVERIS